MTCEKWDETKERYEGQTTVPLEKIDAADLVVRHYYGLATIEYEGIGDLALGRLTLWPYIRVHFARVADGAVQFLFNRRKVVTKQTVEILNYMIESSTHGDRKKEAFTLVEIMLGLYSDRWLRHPGLSSPHLRIEFHLNSLVDTGELKRSGNDGYVLTGKALRLVEEYEEQERKHKQGLWVQWSLVVVTLLLASLAAVQVWVSYNSP